MTSSQTVEKYRNSNDSLYLTYDYNNHGYSIGDFQSNTSISVFCVLNKQLLSLFGVRSERELEQNILENICQASADYSRNVPKSNDTHLQTRLGTSCIGCDWHRKLVSKGSAINEKGRF